MWPSTLPTGPSAAARISERQPHRSAAESSEGDRVCDQHRPRADHGEQDTAGRLADLVAIRCRSQSARRWRSRARDSSTTAGTEASATGRNTPTAAPAIVASAITTTGWCTIASTTKHAAHTRSAITSARRGASRSSRPANNTPMTTAGANSGDKQRGRPTPAEPVSRNILTDSVIAAAHEPNTLMPVAIQSRRKSAPEGSIELMVRRVYPGGPRPSTRQRPPDYEASASEAITAGVWLSG